MPKYPNVSSLPICVESRGMQPTMSPHVARSLRRGGWASLLRRFPFGCMPELAPPMHVTVFAAAQTAWVQLRTNLSMRITIAAPACLPPRHWFV